MVNYEDKVWYACYGSNILEERFLCYIKGGQPNGAATNYDGCTDKTLPTDNQDFYLCCELYFAKKSSNWDNGGVAFVRTTSDPQASTLSRIYLITKGQLTDIARQETKTKTKLTIDFNKAKEDGHYIFKEKPCWYGNLLYLGEQTGYPIFTLTNEDDLQPYTKPSENYLRIICRGIREAHSFDNQAIFEYLRTKQGVKEFYKDEEVLNIIND